MSRTLITAICLGLTLILGIFFLWPKYQSFKNLQLQLKNKEIEFRYQDEYYQELFSLSEKLKEFETELSNIDSALPSNLSLPSLYNFLQKTSSENGLILNSIGSFSLSRLPERTNIQLISIPIEVSGSYPSLKNFLKALEKSTRIIEVDGISFSSPEERELFGFKLGVKTHSY